MSKKPKLAGSIIKSVFKGLAKSTPIIGGIVTEMDKTIQEETEHSPQGKIDWAKIVGYILGGVIIISFLAGWITKEDVKFLINQLIKLDLFS